MVIRTIPAGDLALASGSVYLISRGAYARQKLSVRFKFFITEWFLDLRLGVPYYRDVFGKTASFEVIRSLFRKLILTTPGVSSLASYAVKFDEEKRTLSFAFQAVATSGVVTVTHNDQDFILDLA